MKPSTVAPVTAVGTDIPGESKFARALASSDYHTRSKGLLALHVWLQRKQQVPDLALRKLWKGIMFCFWHSDKTYVQEQLADQLVKIMLDLSDDVRMFKPKNAIPCLVITVMIINIVMQVALSFFRAFLQTMFQEWGSIDKLRLDKFMMLVRKFLGGVFTLLNDHKWCETEETLLRIHATQVS